MQHLEDFSYAKSCGPPIGGTHGPVVIIPRYEKRCIFRHRGTNISSRLFWSQSSVLTQCFNAPRILRHSL